MKELGQFKHFLGLEVDLREDMLFFRQQKYAKDLLLKYEMLNCKPTSTHMETTIKLCAKEGKDLKDPTMYRQLAGSLINLTKTRPDNTFMVGLVIRYTQKPKKNSLRSSSVNSQVCRRNTQLWSFIQERREMSGDWLLWCWLCGWSPDMFQSWFDSYFMCRKRQPTISLSITMAEYRSAAISAQESTWLMQLMEDFNINAQII